MFIEDKIYYSTNKISLIQINGQTLFNATEICKIFEKDVKEFINLDSTIELIITLESKFKIKSSLLSFIDSEKNNWFILPIVIKLSQWINKDFEIWFYLQLNNLYLDYNLSYELQKSLSNSKELLEHLKIIIQQNNKESPTYNKPKLDETSEKNRNYIKNLVKNYAIQNKEKEQKIWTILYDEYLKKYGTDLRILPKERNDESVIDRVSRNGLIHYLYEVADDIFHEYSKYDEIYNPNEYISESQTKNNNYNISEILDDKPPF